MAIRKFRVGLILGMFLSMVCIWPATAETVSSQKHRFRVVTVVEGLEHPWGLAFIPDGGMLVTERPGRLRLVRQGRLDPQPVAGLPAIAAKGQGGLLDVALHPDFAQNRLVYISYAAADEGGIGTEVARGRLNGHRLEGVQTIFRLLPKSGRGIHFGSRLVFDRAGYLFITLGDRGEMARAQKGDDHAGSVIRLHDDGRVPADNPYKSHSGWKAEIYSIGHRNVQGAALHPQTGELWAHEHGPQGGDEINIIRAGNNYGWPVITYGVNYGLGTRIGMGTHRQGMIQPLHTWVPTSIAPSGMAFYEGDRFVRWQGDLFVGALREQMLVRLRFDGSRVVEEEHLLKEGLGRIRDVRTGPDGYLYLLTDHRQGKLVRLEPLGEKEK
ncbi:MAG: PQQ-dependent sugar dehydrogenase [Desulfuromonadales bacterium]|nr:PQQ-dependent sugar dehydrogenase [Desulfuromonadales bacterium]MDW7757920.1 PQQ-dependent sugar dehydrogenase [Desulfuromonadales bacterium]